MIRRNLSLEDYFIRTNFYDLLPLANQIARDLGYGQEEMSEAVFTALNYLVDYLL
jgi:hypothetical protein